VKGAAAVLRRIIAFAMVGTAFGIAAVIVIRAQSRHPHLMPNAGAQFGRAQSGRRSPHETTMATVEGASLEIDYGRPYMRGRRIYGSLVPFDVIWCPGADEATTLDSSLPIRIGGVTVPAGPHTLWVLPTANDWTLIISNQPSGFHTIYPRGADLVRVKFTKRPLADPVEQLTFTIEPAANGGGTITMSWEQTAASVPFEVIK
jgi:hypothetical protein